MDIRNLRHLLAVREQGSFAKAAQVLQISQPSVSTSIGRLEDRLKVKLFDRSAAGSIITPVGEFVADRAGRIIAEFDQVARAAALLSDRQGTVRIGLGFSLKDALMSGLLAELAKARPALHLSLHMDGPDTLVDLLRAHEIDIAICGITAPEVVSDLVVSEIFTGTIIAVASPTHPLVNEGPLSFERFAEFPVAGPRNGSVRKVLRLADESEAFIQYAANDYDALIPLTLNSQATLIVPDFVVRRYVESGALVRLDLAHATVPYAAVTHEATSFTPIVKEIIGRVQQVGSGPLPRAA